MERTEREKLMLTVYIGMKPEGLNIFLITASPFLLSSTTMAGHCKANISCQADCHAIFLYHHILPVRC